MKGEVQMQQWLNLFTKIELFRNVKDNEQQEHDFKVLEQIFTPSKGNYTKLYYTLGSYSFMEENNPIMLPIALRDNKVNIYKYTFERPQEPTEEEVQEVKSLGRCRADRTALLYWWIKCFTSQNQIQLKKAYDFLLKADEVYIRCGEVTGDMVYRLMEGREGEDNKLIIVPFVDKHGTDEYKIVQTIDFYMVEFTSTYLDEINEARQKILDGMVLEMPDL